MVSQVFSVVSSVPLVSPLPPVSPVSPVAEVAAGAQLIICRSDNWWHQPWGGGGGGMLTVTGAPLGISNQLQEPGNLSNVTGEKEEDYFHCILISIRAG